MIRFLTAAFLATSAVAFAQTNPCAAPPTGTFVPIVITYTQPQSTISAAPIPSASSIASSTAHLASLASANFAATIPGPVTLPTPAAITPVTISMIPAQVVSAASLNIQSAQVASAATLGTVLSQVPPGVVASVIYVDTSVGSATALSNGMNIIAVQPGPSSPAAKLQNSATTPVITAISASSNQGACFLYQIAGSGFGSTAPPTVSLASINVICDLDSSVKIMGDTGSVGVNGDLNQTTCPSVPTSDSPNFYWYENEVPATVINSTDSLITIGVPQSLAGTSSLAIAVTNSADNLTGGFCSIQSGNDPCVVSPTSYNPSDNSVTFEPLTYVSY